MKRTARSWALVAGLLAACSDESATTPDAATDAVAPVDVASDVIIPQGDTIKGTVLHFDVNTPAKNVAVTVLDAKGVVRTTTTAADGTFSVAEVVTPYAVRCVDLDDFRNVSWAWDEISSKTVTLGVEDLSSAGWAVHSVDLSCKLQLPNCIGVDCGYTVQVGALATATDLRLSGGTTGTFTNGGTLTLAFKGLWVGTSSSRSATVEALAWDTASFNYWYANQVVTLKDGQPPTCAPLVVASVPAPGSLSATIASTNLGSAFGKQSWFAFEMPSGATLNTRYWNTDTFAAGLPSIGMTSWALSGTASDQTSNAWGISPSQPPSTTTATVSLFGPPVPATPPLQGGSINASGKIAWVDGSGAALYQLRLVRQNDAGVSAIYYFTPQTSVTVDRLKKLGANVDPGSFGYTLVANRPFGGVDSVLAGPNAPKRFNFGSGSRVDVSFTVTP